MTVRYLGKDPFPFAPRGAWMLLEQTGYPFLVDSLTLC
jgi:hypothetical protein